MTDTADDFIAELGRTVKLVVAREVGPLREALVAASAESADLRRRLEDAEAALAAVPRVGEADVLAIINASADAMRAEWAARDAERATDGEEDGPEYLSADALIDALTPLHRALAAIPPPPDISRLAEMAEVETMRLELRTMIEALPLPVEPRDWAPEIAEIRQAIPPPPDVSGFMAKSEGEEIRGLMVRQTAEIRAEFHAAIEAMELKEGPPGPVGKLPIARAWADDVTYAGEVRTHAGSTWQATRDTGKAPGGDDWLCLAGRGEDGAPAPRFRICGTYAEGRYDELDIVALNGASFVALRDDPGPCPGDGWQLWAKQGKPGEKIKGDKGDRGDRAPRPVGFVVDEEAAALTLALEDGTRLTADLYPLLAQVAK